MFLPEPTGTKTPVRCNIALDSDLPMPQSAFLDFPFEAYLESSGGTRHRLAPLRQPIPREERWAGQMVHVEMSEGSENTDERAKIPGGEGTRYIRKVGMLVENFEMDP